MATQTLLSVDDYLALPVEDGHRYELDEGQVIELSAPNLEHGESQSKIGYFFHMYKRETGSPIRVSMHAEFILSVDPPTARQPDVFVLFPETMAGLTYSRGAYLGRPDLAVEIVSKNDNATDLDRKVEQYLAAGVRAVWLLYPETQHVMTYRSTGETRLLRSGDMIEEQDLFPGLRIPVDEVFADSTR